MGTRGASNRGIRASSSTVRDFKEWADERCAELARVFPMDTPDDQIPVVTAEFDKSFEAELKAMSDDELREASKTLFNKSPLGDGVMSWSNTLAIGLQTQVEAEMAERGFGDMHDYYQQVKKDLDKMVSKPVRKPPTLEGMRGHKLLTKALEKKLPKLYHYDDLGTPADEMVAQVKFFDPMSRWTWYGMEYDPKERIFFGYVKSGLDPDFDELGYFSLDELENLKNAAGIPIERDMYYEPETLAKIKAPSRSSSTTSTEPRVIGRIPAYRAEILDDNGKRVARFEDDWVEDEVALENAMEGFHEFGGEAEFKPLKVKRIETPTWSRNIKSNEKVYPYTNDSFLIVSKHGLISGLTLFRRK